ncbi:hypothetical protein, partial [Klebsiella aerogenes]|uniref:hypothetical protein n=1 Tax=Klebsiella aerogenes TaxID=548 RepID=UPI0013D498F8
DTGSSIALAMGSGYSWSVNVGKFLLMLLVYWKDSVVRGFWSLFSLGSAALFVIMWSCFLLE